MNMSLFVVIVSSDYASASTLIKAKVCVMERHCPAMATTHNCPPTYPTVEVVVNNFTIWFCCSYCVTNVYVFFRTTTKQQSSIIHRGECRLPYQTMTTMAIIILKIACFNGVVAVTVAAMPLRWPYWIYGMDGKQHATAIPTNSHFSLVYSIRSRSLHDDLHLRPLPCLYWKESVLTGGSSLSNCWCCLLGNASALDKSLR